MIKRAMIFPILVAPFTFINPQPPRNTQQAYWRLVAGCFIHSAKHFKHLFGAVK